MAMLEKEYTNFVKIAVEIAGKDSKKLKTDVFNEVKDRGNMYDILAPNCSFLDINSNYCETMKQLYPGTEVVLGDIRQLPFGDGCFDMILDLSTIDHILEYKKALLEYRRVLKKNGVLALVSWLSGALTAIVKHEQYAHVMEKFNDFIFDNFNIIADGRFVKGRGNLVWYLARNK